MYGSVWVSVCVCYRMLPQIEKLHTQTNKALCVAAAALPRKLSETFAHSESSFSIDPDIAKSSKWLTTTLLLLHTLLLSCPSTSFFTMTRNQDWLLEFRKDTEESLFVHIYVQVRMNSVMKEDPWTVLSINGPFTGGDDIMQELNSLYIRKSC